MPGRRIMPFQRTLAALSAVAALALAGAEPARGYERCGGYDALATTVAIESYDWGPMVDGLPMMPFGGGLVRNPTTIAQFGLVRWSHWLRDGQRRKLRAARRAADWLVDTQRRDGRWLYGFAINAPGTDMRLPAGWASGMAQGQAASLLVRAHCRTGARRYLRAARKALRSLTVHVRDGGLKRRYHGHLWFEEYPTPRPTLVLNGNLQTLVGLWDLAPRSPLASRLFRDGRRGVLRALPNSTPGAAAPGTTSHTGSATRRTSRPRATRRSSRTCCGRWTPSRPPACCAATRRSGTEAEPGRSLPRV